MLYDSLTSKFLKTKYIDRISSNRRNSVSFFVVLVDCIPINLIFYVSKSVALQRIYVSKSVTLRKV